MNRLDWLRSRYRCAIRVAGMKARPPMRWATELVPNICGTEAAALWDEEREIWEAEMTKLPPNSVEGGDEK